MFESLLRSEPTPFTSLPLHQQAIPFTSASLTELEIQTWIGPVDYPGHQSEGWRELEVLGMASKGVPTKEHWLFWFVLSIDLYT